MNRLHASIARATLPLAVALCCAQACHARAQTVQSIPLNSPKPKPAEKAKTVTLEPPKALPAPRAKEIDAEGPAVAKPGAPPQPKDIADTGPPPATEAPVRSFAPEPVLDRALEQQIRSIATANRTKVVLYAWQLNTAKAVAIDADFTVQTTNTTKLAFLWHSLREISLGDTTWTDKVGNTTLQDAVTRLSQTNDPSAVLELSSRFNTFRVERDITDLGLTGAWLRPAAAPPSSAGGLAYVFAGRTTPRQIVILLQHIGMCDLDLPKQLHVNIPRSELACRSAAGILRNHLYRDTVPDAAGTPDAGLRGEGVLAKTFSPGRSDVAILAAKSGPIVLTVHTYDDSTDTARTIAAIQRAILQAWSPSGTDASLFDKPHLGVSWE